jgi:ethanolamine utilization cobalamin adenosyltransferase
MKELYMTSLGAEIVSKTHGRIAFRGLVDTLEAEVIEAQVLAFSLGDEKICGRLGEILDFLRSLMTAEVKEKPLPPPFLFGMEADEIHRQSHHIGESFGMDFVMPSYADGPLAVRINTLRAKVREVELLAVKVFGSQETNSRDDIILALNRLSSALWWLFCSTISVDR